MGKSKSDFAIRGFVKAVVTNPDGTSFVHLDEEQNTIHSDYADAICDAINAGGNIALDSLFNDLVGANTPPTNGEDGIAIYDNTGGNWYEMACTVWQSGYNVIIEGTFTGTAIDITLASEVKLGHNWNATVFTTNIANPTTWAVLNLLAAQTLTITWTIKHGNV